MYARSLLWSLREIRTCLDCLHSEAVLLGNDAVLKPTNNARRTVHELVELLRSGQLSRPSPRDAREDDALGRLLKTMYETGTGNAETIIERVDGGEKTIGMLRSTGQIERKHDELFVPLRGRRTAQNWLPVLQLIVRELDRQMRGCRALVQKVQADGGGSDTSECITLQSLCNRLETLRKVLRSQLGQLQVINYTLTVDRAIEEFLTEAVPKAFDVKPQLEEIA